MAQIIPAILATTEEEYKKKLDKIKTIVLSEVEGWVQIDLMDNKFVQNRSIGPDVLSKHPTSLKLEAHLMVEYPENWIDELMKIPVARIIFPVEDQEGILERIEHIKNHGVEVGISINPETPVSEIEPYFNQVDIILIMSVHPGFSGQDFIPKTLEKIRRVLRLRSGRNFKISVDGGINEKNAKLVKDAGADNLVIGSYENLKKVLEIIEKD